MSNENNNLESCKILSNHWPVSAGFEVRPTKEVWETPRPPAKTEALVNEFAHTRLGAVGLRYVVPGQKTVQKPDSPKS